MKRVLEIEWHDDSDPETVETVMRELAGRVMTYWLPNGVTSAEVRDPAADDWTQEFMELAAFAAIFGVALAIFYRALELLQ